MSGTVSREKQSGADYGTTMFVRLRPTPRSALPIGGAGRYRKAMGAIFVETPAMLQPRAAPVQRLLQSPRMGMISQGRANHREFIRVRSAGSASLIPEGRQLGEGCQRCRAPRRGSENPAVAVAARELEGGLEVPALHPKVCLRRRCRRRTSVSAVAEYEFAPPYS